LDDRRNSHREIVNAVSSSFSNAAIREAINDCVDRDRLWIDDYFRAYFKLGDSDLPKQGDGDLLTIPSEEENPPIQNDNKVDTPTTPIETLAAWKWRWRRIGSS